MSLTLYVCGISTNVELIKFDLCDIILAYSKIMPVKLY